jgi:transcriptional regulator NrdR family protein
MRCPKCGAETKVARSRMTDNESRVVRRRRCVKDREHVFDTTEQRADFTLRDILVRQTGNGVVHEFNRQRLFEDVRTAVLKRLDDATSHSVVKDVIRTLEASLPDIVEPLTPEERELHPSHEVSIWDTEISNAVDRRLRDTNRMAHVLFGMSIMGREDRGRKANGWKNATDVLNWLYEDGNYPKLRQPIPERRATQTEHWFPPAPPTVPATVIKRRDRTPHPFDEQRFRQSIENCMLGRDNAKHRSDAVTEWVLWHVNVHQEVLSSQLAVWVMECLRRVDDVAYLRWSATAKQIDTVTRFRDEAMLLLTRPSPRLVFSRTTGKGRFLPVEE